MNEPASSSAIRALLIEDDARLAHLMRSLAIHGVEIRCIEDGLRGLEEARRGTFNVILLDVMLPRSDGIEVCRALRTASDVPVIMLTARGDEVDRVLGLEAGADDYVVKPFSARELVARVRAVVRRARGLAGPSRRPLRVGPLIIDPGRQRVTIDGAEYLTTASLVGDGIHSMSQLP
ncbi:response regulator [Nannocystis pusilla]|uniref:response regulator n=1 Tax=Nannocystis pusilla TaxID=889268 RepID=UPI003DA3CDA6